MPPCRAKVGAVTTTIGCILVLFASLVHVSHAQSTCAEGLPNVQKEFVSGGSTFPFYFSLCQPLTSMLPAGCPSGCYGLQKTSGTCYCLGRNAPTIQRTGNTIMFSAKGGDPYSDGTPRQMTAEVTCSLDETAPTVVEMKPTYAFSWTTSLCGPPGSPSQSSGGLSGGSIFSIVFCLSFFFYFAIGMLVKWKFFASTGCDLLPNSSFWKDFPILLKDGIVFALCCGKLPQTSYQSV